MGDITRRRRTAILERDGHACNHCGSSEDLVIDHITPRARGGGNKPQNLQTLCYPCNSRKGNRDAYRTHGFTPAYAIPVKRCQRMVDPVWILLLRFIQSRDGECVYATPNAVAMLEMSGFIYVGLKSDLGVTEVRPGPAMEVV